MPAPPPPSSSFAKQRKKAPRHGSSLPLLAFAGAKKTTYDPRVAKQKASNLAAKRVNEFRKLKARLEAQGKLAVPSSIARATIDAAAAVEGGRGEEEEVRERKREKEKRERHAKIKKIKNRKSKKNPTSFLFPAFQKPKNRPDDDASRRRRHLPSPPPPSIPLHNSTKAITPGPTRAPTSRSTPCRG